MTLIDALLPPPIAWLFVLPAWFLGYRAVGVLQRVQRAVRYEHALLTVQRQNLPAAFPEPRAMTTASRRYPPEPRAASEASLPFAEWRAHLPKYGLVATLVDAVWAQRSMSAPNLDAIHGMVADIASTRLAPVRGVPNLAMLCGLMGTVAGLGAVVQALGPQIVAAAGAADPAELARTLSGQLGHLRTAFSCTLHGIFWAALVAHMLARVETEQDQLLDALQAFSLRDLAPRVFPRSLERHLEALQQQLETSVGLMGSVTAAMTGASDRLGAHVALLETATAATTATLDRVAEHFEQSATVLDASVEALKALQVEVHGVYVSLMDRHEHSEQSFRERAEELVGTVDRLQSGFNTNARGIIEQLQLASGNYAESTHEFREAGVRFGDMSREIGTRAYDAIADRADAFRAALVRHEQAAYLLEGQIRELLDRLDSRSLVGIVR